MSILSKILFKAIKMNNTLLIVSSLVFFTIASWFISYIEPETFPRFYDALWWTATTATTVGYGDVSPATDPGKFFAMFVVFPFGIGIGGLLIGKVIDAITTLKRLKEEGKMTVKSKNHIIIIDYSSKAALAVKEILASSKTKEIVIIDNKEKSPITEERVHYVQGDVTDEETLMKANILSCESVLIFADDGIQDVSLKDDRTYSIASSIEFLSREHQANITTIVEVMRTENEKKFRHANVDNIILSNQMVSAMAVKSAFHKNSNQLVNQLIQRSNGEDLFHVSVHKEWKTYEDAFDALRRRGALLVSDGERMDVVRRLHEPIPKDAHLSVICDEETYEKIHQS